MSSVSDETEYGYTTPVSEFRAIESSSSTRHSSNSPTPYYVPTVPTLTLVPDGIRTLPSNGLSREMEMCVSYCAKAYGQEAEKLASHDEYASDTMIPTVGITPNYVPPLPSATPMPSMAMFPLTGEAMGDSFGAYLLPDDSVPGFADMREYDSNMADALQTISRLSDSQQQQIMAYLLKKNNLTQSMVPDQASSPNYGGYHDPAPGMNLL